jgi:hypothetical protein
MVLCLIWPNFFNWFARQSPSLAINGLYTYLGTFKALSKKC